MNLQGKRALITGGSSGIGFAIAEAMLAKGAQIVITGRRPDVLSTAAKRLRADGGRVDFVAADISTEKGRETTLKFALDKLGGLDVLVNNAGGVRGGRLEDTTEAEIRIMIEVDLVGPILLTRAALPKLRASSDGLVVNITSGIALVAAPFYATYAGVKGGLAKIKQDSAGIEHPHFLATRPFGIDDSGDLAIRIDGAKRRRMLFALAGVDRDQLIGQADLFEHQSDFCRIRGWMEVETDHALFPVASE